MKILHLDSSILGPNSVSRTLSAAVVARLQAISPDHNITYRDLAADPIPHLSGAYLTAARVVDGQHEPALQHDLALSSNVLEEFLAADILVLGVAFYNFTISTQLKAWIDRILIPGKTFRYTEMGPEGLAGSKRAVLAVSRGGFYGPGTPAEAAEHAVSYLKTALGFIGIQQPIVVAADGLTRGREQRDASVAGALQQIAALPSLAEGLTSAAA